jgi:hypothetical protein
MLVTYFKVIYRHSSGETEEYHAIYQPDWDPNQVTPESKSSALPLHWYGRFMYIRFHIPESSFLNQQFEYRSVSELRVVTIQWLTSDFMAGQWPFCCSFVVALPWATSIPITVPHTFRLQESKVSTPRPDNNPSIRNFTLRRDQSRACSGGIHKFNPFHPTSLSSSRIRLHGLCPPRI